MADVPDTQRSHFRNRNLSGGMNDKVFASQIRDDQAVEIFDIDISIPGRRVKRKGRTLIANDAGNDAIVALLEFKPEGGTHRILHRASTELRSWTGTGSWGVVGTGLADGPDADMIQAGDLAFITQGSGANVNTFDGAVLTDEGNTNTDAPRSTHGVYAANRLFLNDTSNLTYVHPSDQLASQTFDRSANAIKFDEGGGHFINGIVKWDQNTLVVATDINIHTLDNIADATVANMTRKLIIPNFGCVARRSMKKVGNDIWFMSRDGHIRSVLRTEQGEIRGGNTPITEAIDTFIKTLDFKRTNLSAAVVFEDAYYISVSVTGNAFNSHTIKIDVLTGGITIYRNWSFRDWVKSDINGAGQMLYGGESQADSLVFEAESGTSDNGTAIEYSETTKRIDFGIPEADKRFQWVEIELIATGTDDLLTIEAQVDGEGFDNVGTMSLKGDAPSLPIALPFDLASVATIRMKFSLDQFERGRNIQFRLTQGDLDVDVTVLGFTVMALTENIEKE